MMEVGGEDSWLDGWMEDRLSGGGGDVNLDARDFYSGFDVDSDESRDEGENEFGDCLTCGDARQWCYCD